mgnify:CR=1 FL=1
MAKNTAELAAAAAAPASPAQAEQEQRTANLAPTTLAGRCAILKRELGLSDMTVVETVRVAATQLGIAHDTSGGKTLGEIAAMCVKAIGVGIGVEPDQPPGPSLAGHQPGPSLGPGQPGADLSPGEIDITLGEIEAGPPAPFWGTDSQARAPLAEGSAEYEHVAAHFRSSLYPSDAARFGLVSIEKLHHPAFKDMYSIALRHMKLREIARKHAGKEALEPDQVEYVWAFHGCSADAVENIIANGLNRSYAGQHATVYGKGVYFARDASYSARETYSPRDDHGVKRVLLCRLALGSHIQVPKGYGNKITELEPPVRDADRLLGVGSLKHDTTTGGDTRGGVPEVMVAYKDSQGYPEYLVTFDHAEERARREAEERARVGPELSALIDLRDANPSLQQKGGWSGLSQSSDLARVSLDGVTVSGGRVTKLDLCHCGLTGTSRSVVVPAIP